MYAQLLKKCRPNLIAEHFTVLKCLAGLESKHCISFLTQINLLQRCVREWVFFFFSGKRKSPLPCMHDDSGQTMPAEFLEPANQCPSHKARVSIRFRFSREKANLFFWGGKPFSDRVATTFQTGFEWFYRLMTNWPRPAHPTPMSTNTPGPSPKVLGFLKSNRTFCAKWVCLCVSRTRIEKTNKLLEKGYVQSGQF